jgi:hypothetical protein
VSLFLFSASRVLAAPAEASFTSVKGTVNVKDKKGKTSAAEKSLTVTQGETISTADNSTAVLQSFDGSTLDIKPNTKVIINALQKPSLTDKIIKFKLLVGDLLAKVKKLTSSQSSFEVEAGGVVCGVRGTQFDMGYNPDTHTVDLKVFEGSVFTDSNGKNNIFNAGQQGEFLNGHLTNPGGNSQTPPDNGKTGNPNGGPSPGLSDLNGQFTNGILVNGDNTFTDPAVAGSVKLNVHVNVGTQETVP